MARHTRTASKNQMKNTPVNQVIQKPTDPQPLPQPVVPVVEPKPVQEKMLVREEMRVPVQEKMLVREEMRVPVQEKMLVREEVHSTQAMPVISHSLPKQELNSKGKIGVTVGVVVFIILLILLFLYLRKRSGSSGQLNSFYF